MNMLSRTLSKLGASLVLALGLSACGGGDAGPPPIDDALLGPILVITDSEPGATAAGDVTFTFTFSTSVGTSFTADDVEVTGGSKGAFAMAGDGTSATLVVVPTPNSAGTITVTVAAGTFEAGSGTRNTLAASASQGYSTLPPGTKMQMSLPVSFDSASVDYGLIGFGGAEDSTVAADPTNAANMVAKVVRAAGAESFAGTTITAAAGLGFSPKVPFTATDTKISVRAWSPDAGIPVRLKVEDHTDATKSVETEAATTVAGGWQTLTFDFKNQVAGTAALNPAYNYDKATIFFDFGRDKAAAVQKSYYFDDVTFVPGSGVGTGTLLVSFDETPPVFTDMGAYGGALPSVEAGPAGGSGNALKILKPVSPDTWGGAYFTVAKIPFAADRKVITARVNSTRAGAVIKFKVEIPGGGNVEIPSSPTGAANTWSTVSWDFAAVDTTKSYTLIAITPDADLVTSGQSYYIDQITLAAATVTPPPPSGTLLLSFDESPPVFSDMGAYGGALPTVEAGPAGGSGNALKIVKPVAPDTWGGTFFMVSAIPFTADRTMLSAKVYATRAGAVIKLKVEIIGGGNVEVAATAGAANTWNKVKWDLSAVDLSKAYKIIAITPDADLPTSGQTYYIDDITLEPADTTPPPPPGATFITFDEAPPIFTDMGAYGGALPSVETGPAGGSGNALKILKPASPDTWGGVFFTTPKIPFTATEKAISARVYSTRADAIIKFKVEIPGGSAVEVSNKTPTGPANTWSTVNWDFSAVDLGKSYKIIAITPDADLAPSGKAYYFDDIKVVPATVTPPPAPVVIATLDEPGAVVTGFQGCWDSTVVADPAGGANKVGRVVKPGSGVPFYCGSTIVTVKNGGFTPIPFTASAKTVTVRVWSPTAGIPVRLKVEDIGDPAKSVETETNTTKVGWQTLSFNFANPVAGTPALNLGTTYNKATIFFKFGSVGTGETYYFDDVTFVGASGDVPLVTFDERNFNNTESDPSVLSGFGGAEDSAPIGFADVGVPADGGKTGKLAKVVKNAGEVWAGTSMQRRANDAVPRIPFVTGATKMSVRVYSAYAGMRVHLKVEESGRPDFNSEVDAFTTKVNTWETLVFDFGPAGKHFVPSGPGPDGYVTDPASPAYRPTSQLDVSKTFNKINIFFDYGLGDAGYDAMPGTRTYYFDDLKFVGP